MKEPFYTYEEFPENLSQEEGMKIISGKDEIGSPAARMWSMR